MGKLRTDIRAAAERMPTHAAELQRYCPMVVAG
jgi:hypothetical protein